MKNIIILLTIFEFSVLFSCKENDSVRDADISKVQVKVTHISEGYLPDYIELTGKTIYLNKNTIVAPISGYVTKVNVLLGDFVSKGKILFELQSQEAYLMEKSDNLGKNYGIVNICAPNDGIITNLSIFKQNIYIGQGITICNIIAANDLKVEVYLPFEFRKYAKIGHKCEIILPDSSSVQAVFNKIMPTMKEQNQTIIILANLYSKIFIPENMIVKILLDKGTKHKTQIIPKNCLMTNPLMTKYWVMKLINDSIAVRVPVRVGNQTHKQIEILSPIFNKHDKIISEGAYGLPGKSLIEIINH